MLLLQLILGLWSFSQLCPNTTECDLLSLVTYSSHIKE